MKIFSKFIVFVLIGLLLSTPAMAYTSDRMDFGDVDFGGETVTIVGWYDPLGAFVEGGDYAGRLEEAKEKFNIGDIKFLQIPWGPDGQETILSRFMAGDSEYDYWMLPHSSFFSLRTSGALYPVSDVLNDGYYDNLPHQHQKMADMLSLDENKYTFSVYNGITNNTVFLAFNKTLLDREGIQDPYELYNNDEWDWEALTEIAKKVTRDTDGDGKIDQWGLTEFNGPDWIHANGGRITDVIDGKVTFVADQSATVNALKQMKEWERELKVVGGTWEKKKFYNGEIAFANLATYQIGELKDNMEDEYGILPLAMGPDTDNYHYPSDNVDSLYLPSNAAQPKEMIALDNFLFRVDEFLEIQDQSFVDRATDETSYKVLQEGISNWTGEAAYMSWAIGRYYESVWGAAYEAVMYGDKTAASATAEIKPQAQALLDEALEQ
ncbi:MAG: ABC transporter substrate-binding protein [Halanaerobiaceae bacterium]